MDVNQLVKVEILTERVENRESHYVALPWSALNDKGLKFYEYFKTYNLDFSPLVAQYDGGYLRRIVPSMVARKGEQLVVMYGGFSNKSLWFDIPDYTVTFGIEECAGKPTVVADFVTESYLPVYQNKDEASVSTRNVKSRLVDLADSDDRQPARKLSDLNTGSYPITGYKSIETQYGVKYLLELKDMGEFWANSRLTDFLRCGVDPTKKVLTVLDKFQTKNGYIAVEAVIADK